MLVHMNYEYIHSYLGYMPRSITAAYKNVYSQYKYLTYILFFFFYYSYVHHPLHPVSLPPNPSIPSRNYFALISNFVVQRV
jgi:hypothetical protein